jgi:hypothetical protein
MPKTVAQWRKLIARTAMVSSAEANNKNREIGHQFRRLSRRREEP